MRPGALPLAALLGLLGAPAAAQFETTPMAVVRPGGGILVADGVSKVPLQIVLMGRDGAPPIRNARIVASEGRIDGTKVVGPSSVQFTYAPPARRGGLDEIFDVALTLADGNTVAEAFTLAVPAPAAPTVEISLDPSDMIAEAPSPVRIQATTYGEGIEGLEVRADGGRLDAKPTTGDTNTMVANATLEIPDLPIDAPSHFVVVGVAAGAKGYALGIGDVPVTAPVRLSVEIPPGTYLEVRGAKNRPPKVKAPADGRTVMEDVEVDITSPLEVFRKKRRRRKQLSVVIPTGVVSSGVVAPIPGQAVADGGVGPTVVVVLPPAAFGAPLFWPDIEVEGAQLVDARDIGPRAKALVLARPREPKTIRVLLDEQPAGTVALSAARGQKVRIEPLAAGNDERAAVSVIVRDAEGNPTDLPAPRVRIDGGADLKVERVAEGRYRAAVPPGTPGAPDSPLPIVAELSPLPKVTGASLEYASARATVTLAGPPPALKAKKSPEKIERKVPARRSRGPKLMLGVGAQAVAGTSLSGMLMIGGGLQVDLRLPWLDNRLAVRTGFEFVRGSKGGGRVAFDDDRRLETTTSVGSVIVPLEVGFAVLSSRTFELLVAAGGELRLEQAALTIMDDSPGGGSAVNFSGRAGVEAALRVGSGAVYLAARAGGIGASLSGFSNEQVILSGTLLTVRGDLGYRLWF